MSDVSAADADESLGAIVQRCELQIAALAGRLDAESLRRSSATREISSTVESQLLAVRSTIHGLAAVRAAVERMGQEVAGVVHHGGATESQTAALDTRVSTLAQSVESQLGGLESKLVLIQGTIEAMRAEIEAVRTVHTPTADAAEAGTPAQGLQDAVVHGELAALRVTVGDVRGELAQLGEMLTRTERNVAEVRRDVEESLGGLHADLGDTRAAVTGAEGAIETLRGDVSAACASLDATGHVVETLRGEVERGIELLRGDMATTRGRLDDTVRAVDGMHGTVTALGRDVGSLRDACDAVGREAAVARDAIAAVREATDERCAALRAESRSELTALRETMHGDTVRAVDGVRGVITALGGDVESLRDACDAVGREAAVTRDAITAVRDATDERCAALRAESRTDLAELRDTMRETIAVLRVETQEQRATSSGELRDGLTLLRGEIERLGVDVHGIRDEVDGRVDVLRQTVDETGAGLVDASRSIAAVRDELGLVGTAVERTHGEARVLRDDLESVRRNVAQASGDGAPENLRELVDAVERLRSGLARQDAIVDERIIVSHRATEALRAELVDMRGQMNEMVALMRHQATTEDAPRVGVADLLAFVLETLRAPITTVQAVVEQVPAVLEKVSAILMNAPAVLATPVVTTAASLLRRCTRSRADGS